MLFNLAIWALGFTVTSTIPQLQATAMQIEYLPSFSPQYFQVRLRGKNLPNPWRVAWHYPVDNVMADGPVVWQGSLLWEGKVVGQWFGTCSACQKAPGISRYDWERRIWDSGRLQGVPRDKILSWRDLKFASFLCSYSTSVSLNILGLKAVIWR